MAVFIINILFNKTKVSVVNWFQWHKNCNTFLEVPFIIKENVRNVLFYITTTAGCFIVSLVFYSDAKWHLNSDP
jgi:hypothetical protein